MSRLNEYSPLVTFLVLPFSEETFSVRGTVSGAEDIRWKQKSLLAQNMSHSSHKPVEREVWFQRLGPPESGTLP